MQEQMAFYLLILILKFILMIKIVIQSKYISEKKIQKNNMMVPKFLQLM